MYAVAGEDSAVTPDQKRLIQDLLGKRMGADPKTAGAYLAGTLQNGVQWVHQASINHSRTCTKMIAACAYCAACSRFPYAGPVLGA